MPKEEAIPDFTMLAVFTVCTETDVTVLTTELSEALEGVTYAGEFQEYVTPGRRPHFPQAVKQALGSIALVDFEKDVEKALATVEIFDRLPAPKITCVGIANSPDTALLLRAMRAGCSEFLQKPVEREQLRALLERMESKLASSMESRSTRGRVLCFFGARGGVGATTLAVHLASYLVTRHGKKTLLIDHHHELGHACLYLGLKPNTYYFDELVRNADRLDADLLNGFLNRHANGLAVIGSPDTCAVLQRTSKEDLERVFEFLRREYDFIVIDSALRYEETAAMIQLSDETYLVATPDIAALRDLTRRLDQLALPEAAASHVRIVINRKSASEGLTVEQIEKAVRLPVAVSLPASYAELVQAINAGELVSPQRRSDFGTQLGKWATQIVGHFGVPTEVAKTGKRKLGFWK